MLPDTSSLGCLDAADVKEASTHRSGWGNCVPVVPCGLKKLKKPGVEARIDGSDSPAPRAGTFFGGGRRDPAPGAGPGPPNTFPDPPTTRHVEARPFFPAGGG